MISLKLIKNCDPFQAEIASDLIPSSVHLLFPCAGGWFDHGLDSLVMSLSDSKNFAELPFLLLPLTFFI